MPDVQAHGVCGGAELSEDPLHFVFENISFDRVVAHEGNGCILTRRVLDASGGCAANFIDLTVIPPGCDIGLHTHADDNEEIYVIVCGSGEMSVDGRQIEVGPGHVIVNRPGGTHGLRNNGVSDLRLVVVEVPTERRPA